MEEFYMEAEEDLGDDASQEDIEKWVVDKISSMADEAYDRYRDGLMEV